MNFPSRLALSLIVASLLALPCLASGLNWEVRERQIATTAGTAKVSASFPFENTTTAPITIVAIDAGCVCTTATTAKKTYGPGERGELAVEFTLGERFGRQDRLITVTTDAADARFQELRLIVDITELITLRPRLIFWAVGEPPVEKSATIILTQPAETTLAAPVCSTPDFTARVEPTARPDTFILHLLPKQFATPMSGTVRLDSTIAGKPHTLTVFAAVR